MVLARSSPWAGIPSRCKVSVLLVGRRPVGRPAHRPAGNISMPPAIVILSCPQDLHAHAMCEALERKGAQARFMYTPDFPSRLGLSMVVTEQGAALYAHSKIRERFGRECTGVWYRRPYFGKTPEELDEEDRMVVERESRDLRLSFFDLLCPSALWVNPLDSVFRERCKPSQLVIAQKCSFSLPPSLVTNH